MKNVLAIEIKDNKTIVTLAKVQKGNYSLLLHKSYGSKPLAKHIDYDVDIIEEIVHDLRDINILNDIDEKYLTVNTSRVHVTTYNVECKYDDEIENEKNKFVHQVSKNNPSAKINYVVFSNNEDVNLTTKIIRATLEATRSDLIDGIVHQFKVKGIEFTKIIPVMKAIHNSVNLEIDNEIESSAISILVEEKFTQLTWIENGLITSSVKWKTGLTNIYEYISKVMRISKPEAKQLFASFGSIPPEDVVDDKVIHTRKEGKEIEVFTKKDLSRLITEKVKELFSNVKYHIDAHKSKEDRVKIIFNGEIKKLMGFRKFASTSFNEPNIKKFKTNIIGLNPETEFITMGILLEVEERYESNNKKRKEHLYTPKIGLLSKLVRMYNYI